MTDHRQGAGRWNEAELRRSPAPRIPRLPAERNRQSHFTALAIWVIFIIAAGALIYSRF